MQHFKYAAECQIVKKHHEVNSLEVTLLTIMNNLERKFLFLERGHSSS